MLNRRCLFLLAAAILGAPAAFAQSDVDWIGGEIGWTSRPVQAKLARAQVLAELEQFRANPVYADGTIFVGGEVGYLPGTPRASALCARPDACHGRARLAGFHAGRPVRERRAELTPRATRATRATHAARA